MLVTPDSLQLVDELRVRLLVVVRFELLCHTLEQFCVRLLTSLHGPEPVTKLLRDRDRGPFGPLRRFSLCRHELFYNATPT